MTNDKKLNLKRGFTPNHLYKKGDTGFTLIETFVAITILITAIAGPLTIAAKGLQSAILARDQLTSSFLGQEGLEYIRQKRDTSSLQGGDWASWLSSMGSCVNQFCTVDATEQSSPSLNVCPVGGCPNLRYDTASDLFSYSLGDTLTNFKRSVTIVPNTNNNTEATITSTVLWTTGTFTRQASFSMTLSDWQGNGSTGTGSSWPSGGPTITGQPESQVVPSECCGRQFSLTVDATGTGSLSYEWYRNGVALGYNWFQYYEGNAIEADEGSYYAIVTDDLGSTQSITVTVIVD